ncbi:MAG: hypothetical protein E7235_01215 [Lachnospiraceae bacterium]|nr:hypothetical protein [Lachnospiraceae bacterium]
MKEITLEAAKMTNKDEALKHIAKKLDFPEYFGNNFDALNDCLTDISEETSISIDNEELFKGNLGVYAEIIKKVFQFAAKQNKNLKFK